MRSCASAAVREPFCLGRRLKLASVYKTTSNPSVFTLVRCEVKRAICSVRGRSVVGIALTYRI